MTPEQIKLADEWWEANKDTPAGRSITESVDKMSKFLEEAGIDEDELMDEVDLAMEQFDRSVNKFITHANSTPKVG